MPRRTRNRGHSANRLGAGDLRGRYSAGISRQRVWNYQRVSLSACDFRPRKPDFSPVELHYLSAIEDFLGVSRRQSAEGPKSILTDESETDRHLNIADWRGDPLKFDGFGKRELQLVGYRLRSAI